MNEFIVTGSDDAERAMAISKIQRQLGSFKVVITPMTACTARTTLQSRALHFFFKIAGLELKKAGVTKDVFYREGFKEAVPATKDDVKELCRAACESLYGKRSTTAIPSDEAEAVHEVVSRALALRFGIDAGPFPSLESMRQEEVYRQSIKEGR